jgi:hypothetical protein
MDRFCHTHSSRGSSRAWRLVLARHSYDGAAQQQVADEIGNCETCWHDTALAAVDIAHNLLLGTYPVPEMQPNGVVTGPSVDLCLARIDGLLEAEELDRRDLERGP